MSAGQHQTSPTGVNRPQEEAALRERVETRGVRFINLEFTDVVGMAKSVTIPVAQLGACLAQGWWFDGSSIESFARLAETDMYLRPDLSTYSEMLSTSDGPIARLLCDVLLPNGERFEGDPRGVLVAATEEAARQGYTYQVAAELEFFLLREGDGSAREPLPHDRGGYFDLSTDLAADVRREMVAELARMGIATESSHHEVAAGQHEIDFAMAEAVQAADALVTARYVIKAVAQRHGLVATFLPKPFLGINGSGMHIHQRLLRRADGRDAFADLTDSAYGLSPVARHFIAGQLTHAAAVTAIVAPLVNSYKRLVPGYEAPVMVTWGRHNREALVRVPRVRSASDPARIELRSPDPSCNPYLAFAVMLHAGLDGLASAQQPPDPTDESFHKLDEAARVRRGIQLLPATLKEALTALATDHVVQHALGNHISDWFKEAKAREWEDYRCQIHPWELERYLPTF